MDFEDFIGPTKENSHRHGSTAAASALDGFVCVVESALLGEKSQNIVGSFVRESKNRRNRILPDSLDDKEKIRMRLDSTNKTISELLRDGLELIEDIRVASDRHEVERRADEADIREDLLSKIQSESIDSTAKFQTTHDKWDEIKLLKDPMHMNDELQLQKRRVQQLMIQKDTIISECRKELLAANERYAKDIKKQVADIQSLVQRADCHVEAMKNILKENLDVLQTTSTAGDGWSNPAESQTLEEERSILQSVSDKNWNDMYSKRTVNERVKVKQEKERLSHDAMEIEQIESDYAEITRAVRIKLERDNETLAIELQKIKTNTTLNSEKLDYNFQVLKKREDENLMVKNAQKRRLGKLHETIYSLKNKLRDTKTNCYIEADKMANTLGKLYASVDQLSKKLVFFSESYEKRFRAVWAMNRTECVNILKIIANIDKVLVEKHLIKKWNNKLAFNIGFLLHFDSASLFNEPSACVKHGSNLDSSTDDTNGDDYSLLEILLQQSTFLSDKQLTNIENSVDGCGKTLLSLDNILSALGIGNIETIRKLKAAGQAIDTEETASDCRELSALQGPLTPSRNLLTLKIFSSAQEKTPIPESNSRTSKRISVAETKRLWDTFKNDFLADQIKVWNIMEEKFGQYLEILRERQTLDDECKFLRKQNYELQHIMEKMLIKPYKDVY